jgi:ligand-binding sensor domain-containing protein
LWLALEQGLCQFTGNACQIYTKVDGLLSDRIYSIVIDQGGIVWVGTEQGVSRFDSSSWKSYPSPVATHDLAVAAGGEIWAATAGGVSRYLPAEDGWITYTEGDGLPSTNAQTIVAGPDGEVWVYLVWQGLYRFDGEQWHKAEGVDGLIYDMAFSSNGTPWIATASSLHYPGGSLSYRDGDQWIDVGRGQALNSFGTVALGPDGIVAISTQLGLGLYQGGEWRLLRDGPTSGRVTSVAVTPDGATWFAFGDHSVSTPGWGLSRFDGQEWSYFLDDAEVGELAVAPDGTLWAGVGCGVQRFDGIAWEIVAHCEDLPAGNILDIDFAPDGTVWMANGFGLARFDGQAWTDLERPVHSLEVAPDGALWVNGWEGTQGSNYVARLDGETWEKFYAADSFPGGFMVSAVTPDGLLWGTTPEGRLASFDGQSWTDGASWKYYEPPGRFQDYIVPLAVAPDGALWLATDSAIARFYHERPTEEAWKIYTQDDGLPEHYNRSIAFGPGSEVWLGATRFQPALTEAGTERGTAAPRVVETASPIVSSDAPAQPTPYCRPSEAFLDLSVPATYLRVGQLLTVTVTLANGDESDAQLGLIQYSLGTQPEALLVGNLEPVEHPTTIPPGDSDQVQFILKAAAPGEVVLSASTSYEMHATDYSWASWSGCQSHPLVLSIVEQ